MLSHLVIRNFAIISQLEIPFEPGLTVMTGETGAGKSIIVDALNLLLGGRASTEVIRTDEDQAVVEGIFDLARPERVNEVLSDRGIEAQESQVVIRRIVSRSGRNKVFINGSLTTVSTLADITGGLVDISGQHEHYSLFDASRHLDVLDAFAELGGDRREMSEAWAKVSELREALSTLQQNVRDRAQRIDFLRFQLEEIDNVAPEQGEDEELRRRLDVLRNAEKIAGAANGAVTSLYEDDDSAVSRIVTAGEGLRAAALHDASLSVFAERLDEARIVVEDVARELQGYADDIEDDPRELDRIQGRLEELRRLERKHGGDIEGVLAAAEEMRAELDDLENADERTAELEARLEKAEDAAFDVAQKLSRKRRAAARIFAEAIERELADLNMARTKFVVSFHPIEEPATVAEVELGPTGFDDVEYLIAPNVGEDPKPLSKIASGGEMSRIMLAIKTVHSDRDSVSTYIFDEVDAGIGGETADMVALKLRGTADQHQVLCITHLPQIASRGNQHYRVEKAAVKGRTQSTIRPLDTEERVDEIARMLGGARVTDKTRDAARELLRS
jgi:DNA repair protein RecN (Recombination protein N)